MHPGKVQKRGSKKPPAVLGRGQRAIQKHAWWCRAHGWSMAEWLETQLSNFPRFGQFVFIGALWNVVVWQFSFSASDLRDDLPCYMNVIVCNFLVLGTAGDPWKVERKVFLPGKTCPIAHMPKCAPWISADWTILHWSFDQHLCSCSGGRDPHEVLQFYSDQLPNNRCSNHWTSWKRLAAGATALRVTDFAPVPIVWFKASKSYDRENYKKSWR